MMSSGGYTYWPDIAPRLAEPDERAEAAPRPEPVGPPISDELAAAIEFLRAELVGFIDTEVSAKLHPMRETISRLELRIQNLEAQGKPPAPVAPIPPPVPDD